MWKVQTESYETCKFMPSGLISRGTNFTDTPDAEHISDGLHTKGPNKVAIGRHGNFFHWGYSASPAYLTEQAKKVFYNAICYMSKFNGQKILTKKLEGGMWLQAGYGQYKINYDYKAEYERHKKETESTNKFVAKIKEKLEKGEKLSAREDYFKNEKIQPIMSFEQFMKDKEPKLFSKFGTDLPKYKAYYKKNILFMRADPNSTRETLLDKEAMELGVSFTDPKFLKTCIDALDTEKKDIAIVLLKRYSNETFATAKEWKKWYNKNKKRLFFTETGGCKFLINPYK